MTYRVRYLMAALCVAALGGCGMPSSGSKCTNGCPGGQVCDETRGVCIALGGGDGGGDGGGGCKADKDCAGMKCDVASGKCVACVVDGDCGMSLKCDPMKKMCVGCVKDADCPMTTPKCDSTSATCVGCIADADCATSPAGRKCDPAKKACVGCLADGDCGGMSPRCDTGAEQCVGCLGDADCMMSTAGKKCDPAKKACTGCLADTDCSGTTPKCDPAMSQCVGCLASADCATSMTGHACDTKKKTCVGCVADTDCGGMSLKCDPAAQMCVGCLANADCAMSMSGKVCKIPAKTCVGCLANADCSGTTPACDVTSNTCVGCLVKADCAMVMGAPICNQMKKQCVGCVSSADCGGMTPACDTGAGKCVACVANADCANSPNGKICNVATKTCVGCVTGADCGGMTPACDPSTSKCVGCVGKADCAANPNGKQCNTMTKTCVPCLTSADCSGTTPVCNMTNQCVGCSTNADCAMSMSGKICEPASKMCVQCLTNADCGGGTCQMNHTCAATCMEAVKTLSFMNGVATVMDDTTPGTNHTSGTCGGTSGPDLVYSLTLAKTQIVTATVTPTMPMGSFEAVVYLRDQCDSTMSNNEVACMESGNGGAVATISSTVPAGNYFLWVDGFAGTKGAYTLKVTLTDPPPPPANSTCMTAAPLTFTMGKATATGDLRGGSDNAQGSCGLKGADAVYTFTTMSVQTLNVTVTADMSTPGYQPVVYLRKVCGSAMKTDELACGADTGFGGGSTSIKVSGLPVGTYFLWVDSYNYASGKYSLTATLGADKCSAAPALTFNGMTATAMTDTTNATNDTAGNCAGSGPEVVYTMTLAQAQSVTVKAVPNASPMYQPVVYVRKACGDSTSEIGCNDSGMGGATATLTLANVPMGTYYVYVDGFGGSKGKATLTVTLGMPILPPANNGCSMPAALALNTAVMGDTTISTDKMGAKMTQTCSTDTSAIGNALPGEDLTYVFTPQVTGMYKITLTPVSSWDPALWVMSAMCKEDGSTCIHGSDNFGAADVLTMQMTMGTAYYVVVDSYKKGEVGTFKLVVQSALPPPANDSCTAPEALNFMNGVATATPDTTNAAQDASGACGGASTPDVVYTFTTMMAQKITAVVTPDMGSMGYTPVVYLRKDGGTCAMSTMELGCGVSAMAGAAATMTVGNAPAGKYYLWVDGTGGSAGKATLKVTLAAPDLGPSNNGCMMPATIALNMTVMGDTTNSKDQMGDMLNMGCDNETVGEGGTLPGPDLTYVFTPMANAMVKITVTPATNWNPALWVMQGMCVNDGSTCVHAADNGNSGAAQSLSMAVTAGVPYYIVVDSYDPTEFGAFSLKIQ